MVVDFLKALLYTSRAFYFGGTMQAKITYTVNVDDIPQEVNKLLSDATISLNDAFSIKINPTQDTLLQSIKSIEILRKKLLDIDTRLSDCYSILVSYNKAIADSFIQENEIASNSFLEESSGVKDEPISE
jgi:hypothetical protein